MSFHFPYPWKSHSLTSPSLFLSSLFLLSFHSLSYSVSHSLFLSPVCCISPLVQETQHPPMLNYLQIPSFGIFTNNQISPFILT